MLYWPIHEPHRASSLFPGGTLRSESAAAISSCRSLRRAARSMDAKRFTRTPAASNLVSRSLYDAIIVSSRVIIVKHYYHIPIIQTFVRMIIEHLFCNDKPQNLRTEMFEASSATYRPFPSSPHRPTHRNASAPHAPLVPRHAPFVVCAAPDRQNPLLPADGQATMASSATHAGSTPQRAGPHEGITHEGAEDLRLRAHARS